MAYPATVLALAHAIGSQFLNIWHGGSVSHSVGTNLMIDDLVGLETKVGVSAASAPVDAPAPNTLLGADAAGTSKWRQVVNADLAPAAAIGLGKLALLANGTLLLGRGGANVAAQLTDAEVAATAGIALTKLQNTTLNAVLVGNAPNGVAARKLLNADVDPAAAIAGSKLAAGSVASAQLGAGAATGFWSVVSASPPSYSGAGQAMITGTGVTITTQTAGPILLGLSLSSLLMTVGPGQLTVQVWEGAAPIHVAGVTYVSNVQYATFTKTFILSPTIGAHTYFLTWAPSGGGAVSTTEAVFWALELRR